MNQSARPISDKSSNWRPERLMKIFLAGMNQRGSGRNYPWCSPWRGWARWVNSPWQRVLKPCGGKT